MYAIAAIGTLMIALSVIMIADPEAWSRGILRFAAKPYFHAAEVGSRLLLGAALIAFAGAAQHPRLVAGLGWLFVFAGVFLVVAGAARHRAFAVRSASFVRVFRPAGIAALAFGAFIVWSALG